MATTYSDLLRLAKQGTGDNANTWGTVLNDNVFEMIEDAIAGFVTIPMAGTGDYTLSTANGSTDEARRAVLKFTGIMTEARNVVLPASSKIYVVHHAATGGFNITLKVGAGATVVLTPGEKGVVYCDGTDVVSSTSFATLLAGNNTYTGNNTYSGTNLFTGSTTFVDSNFRIRDNSDSTKQVAFEVSGVATATTRTITVPDSNGTMALVASTAPAERGVPTGMIGYFARTTAPVGWVILNGQTIGSASSGATGRANADTIDLYTLLWTEYANTELPIQDSAGVATTRGASAAADFAANKRLPVEDHITEEVFIRALKSPRAIGTYQADEFKAHTHTYNSGGIPGASTYAISNGIGASIPTSSTGGTETRPKNRVALPCIKL